MKEKLFGSVMPVAIIERMDHSSDPIGEGVRIAIEVIEELSKIPGVGGVHIMAPMNDAVVPGVISEAKQRVARMVMA
jgi:methylenetetrahydrofolate reductase (NADPH)